MLRFPITCGVLASSLLAAACGRDSGSISDPNAAAAPLIASATDHAPYNLNVVLSGIGSGTIAFRQREDGSQIAYLGTRVQGLTPNTSYLLQRAADGPADGQCTSTAWLTLGRGTQPKAITTNGDGSGAADFFRNLSAFPAGSQFDIRFQVLDATTSAVVLTSGCYQFTIQ